MKEGAIGMVAGLLLGLGVWALVEWMERPPLPPSTPEREAAKEEAQQEGFGEAEVVPDDDVRPEGITSKATTPMASLEGRLGPRRVAPASLGPQMTAPDPEGVQPPAGPTAKPTWWIAPAGWPSGDDLAAFCRCDLVQIGGEVLGRIEADACVQMPGGSMVCRGPESIPDSRIQISRSLQTEILPPPRWAAEVRIMATTDPGIRLGLSKYGPGRWGWALDAEASHQPGGWDYRLAGGLAVRIGRGAKAKS